MTSAQRRGLDYEHTIANEVHDATDGSIFPLRVGWSGNNKIPAPDVFLDDGYKGHAFEFKRTTQDRISLTYNPESDKPDDLSDLIEFARNYPRTCCAYVGVRFTHRQLVLLKFWLRAPGPKALLQSAVSTSPVDARVTHAGNLSVHKPSTEEWPSAHTGDDIDYLLETIQYE